VERLNLRLLNELEVIVGIMLLYWAEAYILWRKTEILVAAGKEIGLEIIADKTN
jgi:hypothetical protein